MARKGVLERVDDEFGDDQPEAHRNIRIGRAVIHDHVDREHPRVMNHRCAEALAELDEVSAKFDFPQPRRCKMLLHGGDGHEPAVGVLEMPAGFVRLNLAGALQKDAGDDLKAVRDAVLHLL